MKLLEKLTSVLGTSADFIVDGQLLKNKIVESALKNDPILLSLLATDDKLKSIFFKDIGSGLVVFDKDKLIKFVSSKEFLPDSYTAFKNKVGLSSNGEYLKADKSVTLVWPYKDCVLEGGQSREDAKTNEIFWNETLAPDEVDQLLAPKVMTKFKRLEMSSDAQIIESTDFALQSTDNLIIKGNNLLALYSIRERYRGQVKLIYIDPPYNTGNDGFQYNDSFNHASWLTFMRSRLEVALDLLKDDGVIFVSIDDNEQAYLKVLMDEIFKQENFLASVIWHKNYASANDAKGFSNVHDYVLVYQKTSKFNRNLLPRTDKQNSLYKYDSNDGKGLWRSDNLTVKTYSKDYDYPIVNPNTGKEYHPTKGRCWVTGKDTMQGWIKEGRVFFGQNNNGAPQLKRYLLEVQDGVVPTTYWSYDDVGHNDEARKEIKTLFSDNLFATPKPEKLIKRIIELSTKPGDIVLDYHLGSGTTAAVAHKMGRQYIGVEQMGYIETISVERLKKVINGEQGGISQLVDWQGGGSFVYCELVQLNAKYVDQIEVAASVKQLNMIKQNIFSDGYVTYKIDPDVFSAEFENLENIEDKKRALIKILDKNHLYVNYSEIDDMTNSVSKTDKVFNEQFYGIAK